MGETLWQRAPQVGGKHGLLLARSNWHPVPVSLQEHFKASSEMYRPDLLSGNTSPTDVEVLRHELTY